MDDKLFEFNLPTDPTKIIKVIGVGGGGGNAVNNMYREGIYDVSFVLCNTDVQALGRSDIPVKITLGSKTTSGLGAGNRPEVAKSAAVESNDEIKAMLSDSTKMVFITAGMGGGTGTGAAPVVAKVAKEMGILTVGIVTIPFLFEGRPKIIQAINGVEEMAKNVDALLVVNNERLHDIYPDLTVRTAFQKADDTLTIAAKSIAEIITLPGIINLDFADVKTTMEKGGVALMSNGFGEGEGRLEHAIQEALNSPLLNNNDVFNARKVLFNISFGEDAELTMEEMKAIDDFMARFSDSINVIWGTALDKDLGKKVKFTIIATGFGVEDIPEVANKHQQDFEQDEIKRQKDEEKVRKYYGTSTKEQQVHKVSQKSIIVLSLDEMDDDNLISYMEENPTYKRDPNEISKIRKQPNTKEMPEMSEHSEVPTSTNIINF